MTVSHKHCVRTTLVINKLDIMVQFVASKSYESLHVHSVVYVIIEEARLILMYM